jgi:hypothetical protein
MPSPLHASQRPPLTLNENRPGPVAAHARLGRLREQVADQVEDAGVGGRVRARRAADRRLVNVDQLVEVLNALDRVVRLSQTVCEPNQGAHQARVERFLDQRRLARPGTPR